MRFIMFMSLLSLVNYFTITQSTTIRAEFSIYKFLEEFQINNLGTEMRVYPFIFLKMLWTLVLGFVLVLNTENRQKSGTSIKQRKLQ